MNPMDPADRPEKRYHVRLLTAGGYTTTRVVKARDAEAAEYVAASGHPGSVALRAYEEEGADE